MFRKAHAHVLMFGEISDLHTTVVTNDLVVMVIDNVLVREHMVDHFLSRPLSFDKMPLMALRLASIEVNDQRVGSCPIIKILIHEGYICTRSAA